MAVLNLALEFAAIRHFHASGELVADVLPVPSTAAQRTAKISAAPVRSMDGLTEGIRSASGVRKCPDFRCLSFAH